jgi:adenine-specific DNA-methyltransferase
MSNSILGLANASQRPNLHYPLIDPKTGWEYLCPPDTGWRFSKATIQSKIEDGRIIFPKSPEGRPREKKFLSELTSSYTGFSSVLDEEAGYTLNGSREVRDLLDGKYFDFPKPQDLLQILIKQCMNDGSGIILDFFAGSGTTAHAILELNKNGYDHKFILVQLPEPLIAESDAYKAGYRYITEITKERIRRVIQNFNDSDAKQLPIGPSQDRGFRVFKLAESNFKPWNAQPAQNAAALAQQIELHIDHIRAGRGADDILYEILLKSGFPLTTPVEKLDLAGKQVFSVASGALLVCLEPDLTLEAIRAMAARKPERVVCLDAGFAGNDPLKTNAVQIFKTQGVPSFKTV